MRGRKPSQSMIRGDCVHATGHVTKRARGGGGFPLFRRHSVWLNDSEHES